MDAAAALDVDTRRRIAIGSTVAVVHAALLLWLGLSVVPVLPEVTTQAMDVVMMRLRRRPLQKMKGLSWREDARRLPLWFTLRQTLGPKQSS